MQHEYLFFEFKHEVKNMFTQLIDNKKLVIFGTGSLATKFIEYFEIKADYYVDNNPLKKHELFYEKPIYLPEHLENDTDNILILIASEAHSKISQQLEKMGFTKGNDFFEILYFFYQLQEKAVLQYATDDSYEYNALNGSRILLDATRLTTFNFIHGISRVMSNLIVEGYKQKDIPFIVVKKVGNTLIEPIEWLSKNNIINQDSVCKKVSFTEGDVWILMDSIMMMYNLFNETIQIAKARGVKVFNCIYDLIPIQHSEMLTDAFQYEFKIMFDYILQHIDGIITDSRSVADEIIEYVDKKNICFDRKFTLGWFHCGCNLINRELTESIKPEIKKIFTAKTFLMVGTIEPRKGHAVVLDAFEKLWALGYDYRLCIAGKAGWKVEHFMERVLQHKELNNRLYFLDKPPDNDLIYCYQNAKALIFASKAEGFGLPIIEAAQFALPLILSDIPVFREIAGEYALYFDVFDSDALKEKIIECNTLDENTIALKSENIHVQTWQECFNQIIDNVIEGHWYKLFDNLGGMSESKLL